MAERCPCVTDTGQSPHLRLDKLPEYTANVFLTDQHLMRIMAQCYDRCDDVDSGILYIPFGLLLSAWRILTHPQSAILSRYITTICIDDRLRKFTEKPWRLPWIVAFGDIAFASSGKAPE